MELNGLQDLNIISCRGILNNEMIKNSLKRNIHLQGMSSFHCLHLISTSPFGPLLLLELHLLLLTHIKRLPGTLAKVTTSRITYSRGYQNWNLI